MTRQRMLATTAATVALVTGALVVGTVARAQTTASPAADAAPAPATGAAPDGSAPAPGIDPTVVLHPIAALADVVITAQRRPQDLQAVPLAVTAFPAETLDTRRITTTLALGQYVPNMFAANSPGLGSANSYYIRGLGTSDTASTIAPQVGTFVDGIYLPRQSANNFDMFDVDHIEVLRGAQGTLLGRDTAAGAIGVALRQPGDRLAGYFEGGYGSFDTKMFRASMDIPAGEMLSVKLSGYYTDGRGYAKDTTTGQRVNDNDSAGLRGAFRAQLSDRLSWNGAVAYMRNDGENLQTFTCDLSNPANCKGRFASTGLRDSYDAAHPSPFAALGISGRKADFGLGNRAETVLATSDIKWESEAATVDLITGGTSLRQKYGIDYTDGRAFPTAAVPLPPVTDGIGYTELNDSRTRSFSQEVKVTGKLFNGFLDYVAGGYYYHESDRSDVADILGGGPTLLADRTLDTRTNSKAGYIQVDAHLTDALTLTGGGRYTDEKNTLDVGDNRASCHVSPVPSTCLIGANLAALGITDDLHSRYWTPRAEISYRLQDVLLFASASRGVQSPGWNGRATTVAALQPFDAEKVWSYEGGVRSEFLDKRLRVNVTGFYQQAKDFQLSNVTLDGGGVPAYSTLDIARYRNHGVEVEVA
ncbi:MAG: TonB-dependent receptor, partial [Janthinobacterium lividum]